METFKLYRLTLLIYAGYAMFFNVNCNEISQGDQRRKLEFLYRYSNYSAVLKEFSNAVTYDKDLDIFEKKISNLKDEIIKSEPVKNWSKSIEIKENLLTIISDDMRLVSQLKKKNLSPDENIWNQDEIEMINKRISAFIEELSITIVQVGKE
ncbi:MAG TPA: hypothetical protein PKD83_08215 [Ignavibacteria bacterium]|nr:hypothetical protein [Ignavibacteria bacterium]